MAPIPALSPAANLQRELWSADAEGWALHSEPHTRPLFEALLNALGVGPDTRILDIGCGTGLALHLAHERGAKVTGIDVSDEMLRIARDRLRGADLRAGDLQVLPFGTDAFDAVLAVNALQFAADPVAAMQEAARVCDAGGLVGIGMFGDRAGVESHVVHVAMSELSPPAREADHVPFALGEPGRLEEALQAAGLVVAASGEVDCVWRYASQADALRGLIGSAGGTRAVQDAGVERTRATVLGALTPFVDPVTGTIVMHNGMRWVTARKEGS
ncbi:class I SAM-dependent methyltransferase [soil metagenome]